MGFKDLTLCEKRKLLIGAEDGSFAKSENLGGKIYQINMGDGPSGPHFSENFTWLPSIANLASSWSVEATRKYVDAIADQCIINGVDLLLGPAINIKRLPQCGRNFEYFSEDPFLAGALATEYIATLQQRGIGATVKHFFANNREYSRLYSSSNMDERTLREIYVKPFEMTMKAEPWAVMCSYNAINGEWAADSKHALVDILRDALGYKNLVMSDWGAVHDRAKSLAATLDLEMPFMEHHHSQESLSEGLKNGVITEADVDSSVTRLEALIEKINEGKKAHYIKYTDKERHDVAVELCEEGIVLLKNESEILPLKSNLKIAVIGEQAVCPELSGGGSSNLADDPENPYDTKFAVNQPRMDDLLREKLSGADVSFAVGYHSHLGYGLRYCTRDIDIAVENAKRADVAVVFVGTNRVIECEGYDREDLKLPALQLDIIDEVCRHCDNVVVVITAGSVVDVSSFKDKVKAILYVGFGGEGANEAISNILVGRVSPSGKLAETFISDTSVNPLVSQNGDFFEENYDDGIFVGYRLYNTKGINVEYPFGHGLSYTDFEYSDLYVSECENGDFNVTFNLKNIGAADGKEVCQLYIFKESSNVERASMELKGFAKVSLNRGESSKVQLHLERSELAYFDIDHNAWIVEPGTYKIMIGSSSRDIKLMTEIRI